MSEWILGGLVLAGSLAVGYYYGLSVFGSLWRRWRARRTLRAGYWPAESKSRTRVAARG